MAALIGLALTLGMLVAIPPEPAEAATCPCSIFTASQAPAGPSDSDTAAVELGVKFRADQDGIVTGIRFYKGTGNTGAHTGSLWTSGGNRLATVTLAGRPRLAGSRPTSLPQWQSPRTRPTSPPTTHPMDATQPMMATLLTPA